MERPPTRHPEVLHLRARERGVDSVVYRLARAVFEPFARVWFRLERVGGRHVPQRGGVILAANHRSFLDPFVIALVSRRPLYYVAKRELFANRLVGWMLNALGAFPVERGRADRDMVQTATAILARGDALLIFPEGTRVRPARSARPAVASAAWRRPAPTASGPASSASGSCWAASRRGAAPRAPGRPR